MDSVIALIKKILNFIKDAAFKLIKVLSFGQSQKTAGFEQQIKLDKKLVFSLSKSRIPNWQQMRYLKKFLSLRELLVIRVSCLIIAVCLIIVGSKFYKDHLQVRPIKGGKYTEALVGAPIHINPLYASINDVDSDLSSLIYSSLFRRGKNGELVKDLVDNYEVSPDGKVYTFTIKSGIKWQAGNSIVSGSELNADDMVFTFAAIQSKQYQSPLRDSFVGVEIEKIDNQKIKFTLAEPYAAFLDLLTFGIMPANLWSEIAPELFELTQYQKKPIGSGIYRFDQYVVDKAGNIKEYDLVANSDYYGQQPYIDLSFKFYPSYEEAIAALNNNEVDGLSYLPLELKGGIITPKAYNYNKLFLPQLTAIFLNKDSNQALGDKSVRQALAYAIDRKEIINQTLGGDAYLVDGPILPNSFAYDQNIKKYDYNPTQAGQLLDNTDWKLVDITPEQVARASSEVSSADEKIKQSAEKILRVGTGQWRQKNQEFLVIKLSTVDRNENRLVAEEIKKYWESAGVKTELEILPASQVQTEVIKNRSFDALFYGQVLGGDPDPYAFWHSSQTGTAGFNIANYINKEADQLIEDARLTSDIAKRQELYKKFQAIIVEEEPAIFMYSPVYTYVQNAKLKGFTVKDIVLPSDRLADVQEWYLQTGKQLVW
ncbi:MAG: ABC transporter substrate-binding protein [Candidatus Falkowbacteria bacterium]|nr:ABC transporter substrate-binding protein [Candidatus Falkowbacteria bacterium]